MSRSSNAGSMSGGVAAKGVSLLVGSRIAMMALSFLSAAVLARLLSPTEFGILAGAFVVTSLADAIFEGAFGIGLVQRRELDARYVATTVTLSLILASALWLFVVATSSLVEDFFQFPNLADVLSLTGITILFKALGSPSRALLQRHHKFQTLAIIPIVSYLIGSCIVSITLALFGFGVWSLVWGFVITSALEGLACLHYARIPLRPHLSKKYMREVVDTSGLFTLSQTLSWATLAGSNIVVGRMLGAEALGLFSRGGRLLNIVVSAAAVPMGRVLLPAFSRLQDDLSAAREAFLTSLSISLMIFTAVSAVTVIHAAAIVKLALGDNWSSVVPIVQLLFLSVLPRCTYKISESLAYGFGRSGAATIRQMIYAFLAVGGALIGVRYGAVGAAAASAVAIWLFYLISLSYASYLVSVSPISIALIHARALVIVVPALVADLLVIDSLSHLGFWASQTLGGIALGSVLMFTWVAMPRLIIGPYASALREVGIARVKRLLTRKHTPPCSANWK